MRGTDRAGCFMKATEMLFVAVTEESNSRCQRHSGCTEGTCPVQL
jgi:hypothetical protein